MRELSDAQIEELTRSIHDTYGYAVKEHMDLWKSRSKTFNTWLDAVIVRAKREEREETVAWMRRTAAVMDDVAYGSAIGWMAERLENKEATDD